MSHTQDTKLEVFVIPVSDVDGAKEHLPNWFAEYLVREQSGAGLPA